MNVSRTYKVYNYESDLTVYPANRVSWMSVALKILSKMVSLAIFTLYCGQLFVALLYRAARQTRVALRVRVALIYFYTFIHVKYVLVINNYSSSPNILPNGLFFY